jgi:hypothetical protein
MRTNRIRSSGIFNYRWPQPCGFSRGFTREPPREIPILEKESGKTWKRTFSLATLNINPGDKKRTVTKIVKVVSGDTPEQRKVKKSTAA